jgi:hypothetical protein
VGSVSDFARGEVALLVSPPRAAAPTVSTTATRTVSDTGRSSVRGPSDGAVLLSAFRGPSEPGPPAARVRPGLVRPVSSNGPCACCLLCYWYDELTSTITDQQCQPSRQQAAAGSPTRPSPPPERRPHYHGRHRMTSRSVGSGSQVSPAMAGFSSPLTRRNSPHLFLQPGAVRAQGDAPESRDTHMQMITTAVDLWMIRSPRRFVKLIMAVHVAECRATPYHSQNGRSLSRCPPRLRRRNRPRPSSFSLEGCVRDFEWSGWQRYPAHGARCASSRLGWVDPTRPTRWISE